MASDQPLWAKIHPRICKRTDTIIDNVTEDTDLEDVARQVLIVINEEMDMLQSKTQGRHSHSVPYSHFCADT